MDIKKESAIIIFIGGILMIGCVAAISIIIAGSRGDTVAMNSEEYELLGHGSLEEEMEETQGLKGVASDGQDLDEESLGPLAVSDLRETIGMVYGDVADALEENGVTVKNCYSDNLEKGLIADVDEEGIVYVNEGPLQVYDEGIYGSLADYIDSLEEKGLVVRLSRTYISSLESPEVNVTYPEMAKEGDTIEVVDKIENQYFNAQAALGEETYTNLTDFLVNDGLMVKYAYDDQLKRYVPETKWGRVDFVNPVLGDWGYYFETLDQMEASVAYVQALKDNKLSDKIENILFVDYFTKTNHRASLYQPLLILDINRFTSGQEIAELVEWVNEGIDEDSQGGIQGHWMD